MSLHVRRPPSRHAESVGCQGGSTGALDQRIWTSFLYTMYGPGENMKLRRLTDSGKHLGVEVNLLLRPRRRAKEWARAAGPPVRPRRGSKTRPADRPGPAPGRTGSRKTPRDRSQTWKCRPGASPNVSMRVAPFQRPHFQDRMQPPCDRGGLVPAETAEVGCRAAIAVPAGRQQVPRQRPGTHDDHGLFTRRHQDAQGVGDRLSRHRHGEMSAWLRFSRYCLVIFYTRKQSHDCGTLPKLRQMNQVPMERKGRHGSASSVNVFLSGRPARAYCFCTPAFRP